MLFWTKQQRRHPSCRYSEGLPSSDCASLGGAEGGFVPEGASGVGMLGEVLAIGGASCAGVGLGAATLSAGAGSEAIGGGTVATGAGIVVAGAGMVEAGGAIGAVAGLLDAGAAAIDSRFVATGAVERFEAAALATCFGGSLGLAGTGAGGCASAFAGGADASVPASASVVAEAPLPLASAAFEPGFVGSAAAVVSLAGLSVTRSSTNAPPITVTVIAASANPKWLLTGPPGADGMPVGAGRQRTVARRRCESEGAYSALSPPADSMPGRAAWVTLAA